MKLARKLTSGKLLAWLQEATEVEGVAEIAFDAAPLPAVLLAATLQL
jgi:hypothetical protein